MSSAVASQLGVPRVAERVAEQIEAEHGETDGQARKDREPRRLLHERAAGAAQHEPPGRRGRLGTEPEEAERGLNQNGVAEPDRRDDEDRGRDVRKDVETEDVPLTAAQGLRRLDVAVLL